MLYNVQRDAALNSDQPEQYHLSVHLSLDGILYALLHKPSQTYHYVSAYKPASGVTQLEEIIENDELLRKHWHSKSIMFSSKNYLLMPKSIMKDSDSVEAIYRFQFATSIAQKVVCNSIPDSEIVIVYSTTNEISTLVSKYFGKVEIVHHAVPFLQTLLKFPPSNADESSIHVQFHKNFIDIAILKQKQVQFCNSFHVQTPEDAIYYIMNAFQHSGCITEKNILKLSGMIADKSDTRRLLDKYFPLAQIEKIDSRVSYRYPFELKEVHSIVNLLNLYHCE